MKKFLAYLSFLLIFLFPITLLNIYTILTLKNYVLFLMSEIILLEVSFNILLFFSKKFKMKIKFKKRVIIIPSILICHTPYVK